MPSLKPGESLGKIILVGVLGGLLAGVFGVGGGIVMVPLLVLFLGLDQRTAATTSLLAIIPISVLGALGYATGDAVDWPAGVVIGLGSIIGGQIGVRLLPRVPIPALQLSFAVLLLYSAYHLLQPDPEATGTDTGQWWLLVLVGLVAGILAGLLGIGGGIVIIPGLVLLAGVDLDTARGTSLLVVLITAATASITTVRSGQANTAVGLWAGLAGAPAALAASLVAQSIPQEQAAWLFAGLMVVAAVQLVLRAWKALREDRHTTGD